MKDKPSSARTTATMECSASSTSSGKEECATGGASRVGRSEFREWESQEIQTDQPASSTCAQTKAKADIRNGGTMVTPMLGLLMLLAAVVVWHRSRNSRHPTKRRNNPQTSDVSSPPLNLNSPRGAGMTAARGAGGGFAASPSSPSSPLPKMRLSASSDCDSASFSSTEEETEEDDNGHKPLQEITTTDGNSERFRLMKLEHQVQQLLAALQLSGNNDKTLFLRSPGEEGLLAQVQRLDKELQLLKEQQKQKKQSQSPLTLQETITNLVSRMRVLESHLGEKNETKKELQQRIEQLEHDMQHQKTARSSAEVGRDLLLQKAVMDLTYQVQDLEDKVEQNADVMDVTMSLWENRLDLHQAQQNKAMTALKTKVQEVSNNLDQVQDENKNAISNLKKEQQQQSTEINTKLQELQEQFATCQAEWKAALAEGLQSWDDKLAAYKKSQEAATAQLNQQMQGLQGELEQAKLQTQEAQDTMIRLVAASSSNSYESQQQQPAESTTTTTKKKFKLWKKSTNLLFSSTSSTNNNKTTQAATTTATKPTTTSLVVTSTTCTNSQQQAEPKVEVELKEDTPPSSRPSTPSASDLADGHVLVAVAVATKCEL